MTAPRVEIERSGPFYMVVALDATDFVTTIRFTLTRPGARRVGRRLLADLRNPPPPLEVLQ